MQFFLSEEAENDLEDIYIYSHENWGKIKAVHYLEEIEKTIETLATHPKVGSHQTKEGHTYYSFPCQSHIIYYQIQTDFLYILTILHKSRMPVLPKARK